MPAGFAAMEPYAFNLGAFKEEIPTFLEKRDIYRKIY